MRLVSTTLTGNSEAIIGDALRSVVDWVDTCLVIDTGVTDESLEIARKVAGDKFALRTFPWTRDFSAARNFALDAARELGGDWSLTVDTDERVELRGENIRSVLDSAREGVLMVTNESGHYAKERFFRLPAVERFTGPTHESFPAYKVGHRTLSKARFLELPKTPEEYKRKFERDAELLREWTASHPKDPRWFYYLGDALQQLGQEEEAIAAFKACSDLRGWDEEAAWACYRAADCFIRLGRFDDAVERCAIGLTRHPGIAELPWLAGFACWKAGRPVHAAYWARLAIPMGRFRGVGESITRIGFKHPPALYEGPYDILRYALKAAGDGQGAIDAEQMYYAALRARKEAGL